MEILATFGVLLGIALLVSLMLLLIERGAGPIRTVLTILAALGGAWLVGYLTNALVRLVVANVLIVPAVVGAIAGGLLFRSIAERFSRKKRVQ